MDKTAILCHFPAQTIDLWENARLDKLQNRGITDTNGMLDNFIAAVNNLKWPVYFSFEKTSTLTEDLVSKILHKKAILPYSHEILLLKNIFKQDEILDIYYLDSIYPLLDGELTAKLNEIHQEYMADFSFNENTPAGITGVFFGKSLFEAMVIEKNENSESTGIDESIPDRLDAPLRHYIEKNINNFHVEVNFEHPDLRLLRLDFSCITPRSLKLTFDFFSRIGAQTNSYDKLETILSREPEILHHFPSYIELEIEGDCEYKCTFCARQFVKNTSTGRMSRDEVKKLIDFSATGLNDTTFALGGLGEPLQHPEAADIIKDLISTGHIPSVIIETNGFYLEKIAVLAKEPGFDKIRFIVNINSLNNYEAIHGTSAENKNKVFENLRTLAGTLGKINPALKKHIFIQTLKIIENESELDEIYALTEELGISFLLQKYNSVISLMPQKRVSDMTPLERSFCWHLRRDLYIRANGDIAFCKQDVEGKSTRGNFLKNNILEIWNLTREDWKKNYLCHYPALPDCANCDEYYTFNM